jgi:CBS domain-containing protein
MSNNATFLDLFNHLDESCRNRYHLEDRTSSAITFLSGKLAHSSSKEDNDLGEALDAIRQLRNTLVHVEKVEGQDLAEVNPLLITTLQKAILYVEKPPRAIDKAIPFESLYHVELSESLEAVLDVMQRRGFSHVPVLQNGHLYGIFSQEVLADYLLEHGGIDLDEHPDLAEFSPYLPVRAHRNERYLFLPSDVLLEDVRESFATSKSKTGKRLGMIFLTLHGQEDEPIKAALVLSNLDE